MCRVEFIIAVAVCSLALAAPSTVPAWHRVESKALGLSLKLPADWATKEREQPDANGCGFGSSREVTPLQVLLRPNVRIPENERAGYPAKEIEHHRQAAIKNGGKEISAGELRIAGVDARFVETEVPSDGGEAYRLLTIVFVLDGRGHDAILGGSPRAVVTARPMFLEVVRSIEVIAAPNSK
jgi:hypothetical protein